MAVLVTCSVTEDHAVGSDNVTAIADQVWSLGQTCPDGFTVDVRTMQLQTEGIAVSYAATQNSHTAIRSPHCTSFSYVLLSDFYLICYVPNAQDGLARIDYRCEFEDAMREYMRELDRTKPVIYGDLNVAHSRNRPQKPAGPERGAMRDFSDEERGKMSELLGAGFTDTFRHLYPETVTYSWWSYRMKAKGEERRIVHRLLHNIGPSDRKA